MEKILKQRKIINKIYDNYIAPGKDISINITYMFIDKTEKLLVCNKTDLINDNANLNKDHFFCNVPIKYITKISIDDKKHVKCLYNKKVKYNKEEIITSFVCLNNKFYEEILKDNYDLETIKIAFSYNPYSCFKYMPDKFRKDPKIIINLFNIRLYTAQFDIISIIEELDKSFFENKDFILNFLDIVGNFDITTTLIPIFINRIIYVDKDILLKFKNCEYSNIIWPIFSSVIINKNLSLLNDSDIINLISDIDSQYKIKLIDKIKDFDNLKKAYTMPFIASHLYLVNDNIWNNKENLLEILNTKNILIDIYGFNESSELLIFYKNDKEIIHLLSKRLMTGFKQFSNTLNLDTDDIKELAAENFLFFNCLNEKDKEIFLDAESLEIEDAFLNFRFQAHEIIFPIFNGSIRLNKESDDIYMVDINQNVLEIHDKNFQNIILNNMKSFLEEKYNYKFDTNLNYDTIFYFLKNRRE